MDSNISRPKRNIDNITASLDDAPSGNKTGMPVSKENSSPNTMTEGSPRQPPLTSQSDTAALLSPSATPEISRSLPNVTTDDPGSRKNTTLTRRPSRPFKLNKETDDEKKNDCKKKDGKHAEGVANWAVTKGQKVVSETFNCIWECGTALVHDVASLVEPVCSYFHPKDKVSIGGSRQRLCSDNEELMALMENQTQTLLEINKFLREELVTIKEERDTAEQMVSRIEKKCREAIAQEVDSVETHVLFDILFGAGSSNATFGKFDVPKSPKPEANAKKTFGPQNPGRDSAPTPTTDLMSPDYGLRVLDSQNRIMK